MNKNKIRLVIPCWRDGEDRTTKKYYPDYGKASLQMGNPIRYANYDKVRYCGKTMTRSDANNLHRIELRKIGEIREQSTHVDMIKYAKSLGYKRVYPAIEELGKHQFKAMFKASEYNSKTK